MRNRSASPHPSALVLGVGLRLAGIAGSAILSLPGAVCAGPHGPPGWARGDMHQHTRHSDDGTWEPADLWARIRELLPRGPRFVYLSDHCEIAGFFPNPVRPPKSDNWGSWEETREIRRSLHPDELILTAQEIGGLKGGHIGAIGLPQCQGQSPPRIILKTGNDYRGWMERVKGAGGLNVVYHPRGVQELGPVHPGTFAHWDSCLPLIDGISVWNGYKLFDAPDEWAWNRIWGLWQQGYRMAAVSGSDAHQKAPDDIPLEWWGREGKISFHCHPMNPHLRVRVGETLDEDRLRQAIRDRRITLADWPENWMDVVVTAGEGRAAGIGETVQVDAGTRPTVRVEGYGSPEVYSGDPVLEIEVGRIGEAPRSWIQEVDEEGSVSRFAEFPRRRIRVPMAKGEFSVVRELDLDAGRWLVTARVVPESPLANYWRGVQLSNPIEIVVP